MELASRRFLLTHTTPGQVDHCQLAFWTVWLYSHCWELHSDHRWRCHCRWCWTSRCRWDLMLLYHKAGIPLLRQQMEKEIGIFAFPPDVIKIRFRPDLDRILTSTPTCFISERSTPVLTLRTIMTMRIMAVKDPMMMPMTRDIVGDIPLSDSIFCLSPTSSSFWRELGQTNLNTEQRETYSDGVLRDLVHIVLLVVSLLGALLGRVVADGLPMVVWVSSVGKVVKICVQLCH